MDKFIDIDLLKILKHKYFNDTKTFLRVYKNIQKKQLVFYNKNTYEFTYDKNYNEEFKTKNSMEYKAVTEIVQNIKNNNYPELFEFIEETDDIIRFKYKVIPDGKNKYGIIYLLEKYRLDIDEGSCLNDFNIFETINICKYVEHEKTFHSLNNTIDYYLYIKKFNDINDYKEYLDSAYKYLQYKFNIYIDEKFEFNSDELEKYKKLSIKKFNESKNTYKFKNINEYLNGNYFRIKLIDFNNETKEVELIKEINKYHLLYIPDYMKRIL